MGFIVRAFCVLAALAGAAVADPVPELRYEVNGLEAPAEILIDEWGVPHIYARTHYDAFFVQGFNAARDRLWQIDLWRRRGLGELASVLGEAYAAQDRAARLFLYRGDMYREWLAYGSDAKRIAEAFVAGINAYVTASRQNPDLVAPEFGLLGYAPAVWSAEDVVRIRSHGLWRNVTSEALRARLYCRFGPEVDALRKRLEPPWKPRVPEGLDPCSIPEHVLDDYERATAPVRFEPQTEANHAHTASPPLHALGSNNWAVAPQRTGTGRALLANDPHRAHGVPSLRYAVHLNAPELDVVGAGEPALPGISIGHNQYLAFGLTIFGLDQEDLYVYETDPADPGRYRYGTGWEPFRVQLERVAVADGPAQEVELKFTRHGPVVFEDRAHHRAFAVRAGWLEPGMAPYFGSVEYMRARTAREFVAALNRWGAPSENQVYADVAGNIGYKPAGLFPRRTTFDGLMPVPGDGRYEWEGFFDMDALPEERNPARGFVATANALTLPPDYPIEARRVGFEWTGPWRQRRIIEVLSSSALHGVAESLALQRDYISTHAREMIARLPAAESAPPDVAPLVALLRGWNARLDAGSSAGALYMVWYHRHLLPALTRALAPADAAALIDPLDSLVVRDVLEAGAAPSIGIVFQTLRGARDELTRRFDADPASWRWGELHRIELRHPLLHLADGALAARMKLPPYPRGGSADTLNNNGFRSKPFDVVSGASFRVVVDVGNWDAARMTNTPGQSGDPRSPFYGNLLENWAADGSVPLLFTRPAIERHTVSVVRLVPAQ